MLHVVPCVQCGETFLKANHTYVEVDLGSTSCVKCHQAIDNRHKFHFCSYECQREFFKDKTYEDVKAWIAGRTVSFNLLCESTCSNNFNDIKVDVNTTGGKLHE